MSASNNLLSLTFILGAMDPEMAEIKNILLGLGCTIVGPLEGRTAPLDAYKLDRAPASNEVYVECAPLNGGKVAIKAAGARIVDHHFAGDPGFGVGPRDAYKASSIGQIVALLRELGVDDIDLPNDSWHPGALGTPKLVLIGERDHSLAAWVAGNCLTPREIARNVYVASLSPAAQALLPEALALLEAAPLLEGTQIRDIRNYPELTPTGRLGAAFVPASILAGVPYVGWGAQGVTEKGRHISAGGAGEGSPVGVIAWKPLLAAMGAVGVFGDDIRGFAGGYIPQ